MVTICVSSDELDLLAVGDGGIHSSLFTLRVAAAGALAADEAHPPVSCGPVLGEIIEELHGVAVFKFLIVDGGFLRGDEVHAGLGIGVAVEGHAAALTGHARIGEGNVLLLISAVIDLHFQVVSVAGLVLKDEIAAGNAASGMCLVKFPVRGYIGSVRRACPVG